MPFKLTRFGDLRRCTGGRLPSPFPFTSFLFFSFRKWYAALTGLEFTRFGDLRGCACVILIEFTRLPPSLWSLCEKKNIPVKCNRMAGGKACSGACLLGHDKGRRLY
jgi:hypothetical protein